MPLRCFQVVGKIAGVRVVRSRNSFSSFKIERELQRSDLFSLCEVVSQWPFFIFVAKSAAVRCE